MTTNSPLAAGYVLVCVGHSPAAASAARWAAAEAVRRDAVLYAVHVIPATYGQQELADARRRVPTRVGAWLTDVVSRPVVAVRVATGDLTEELRACAQEASVVVLGEPDVPVHDSLPRLLARVCPGVVVVVDAEGRAENIASDEVGKGAIEVPVVRDVMTSPALTVEANDLLTQVVRRLDLHDVTSLPVVDAHGHLVGVVGEADVMRQLARNSTHNDERVRDVMATAVWTASADEPLIRVAELFGRTSLKSLPVVLRDAVVGVISRRDLVRAAARHQLPATL